jgi:hypothetical protein
MSVGTIKEPRSKCGGKEEKRWKKGGEEVEELWRRFCLITLKPYSTLW